MASRIEIPPSYQPGNSADCNTSPYPISCHLLYGGRQRAEEAALTNKVDGQYDPSPGISRWLPYPRGTNEKKSPGIMDNFGRVIKRGSVMENLGRVIRNRGVMENFGRVIRS